MHGSIVIIGSLVFATAALAEDASPPNPKTATKTDRPVAETSAPLLVGDSAHDAMVKINGTQGGARGLEWQTKGTDIWRLQTDPAGDLQMYSYDPQKGSYIGSPFGVLSSKNPREFNMNWFLRHDVSNAIPQGGIVGANKIYTNNGGHGGQGEKLGYFSNAGSAGDGGFDLGSTRIAIWNPTGFPASGHAIGYEADWVVAVSPADAEHNTWSMAGEEMNIVNRGADRGFQPDRFSTSTVTGMLMVPETNTFGQPGNTYNANFAYAISRSGAVNKLTGVPNKWYIGYNCEPDSEVGATGRCFYATGDTTGKSSQYPFGPFQVAGAWLHGLDTTKAQFSDKAAFRAGPGQIIGMADGTSITGMSSTGTGPSLATTLLANGGTQVQIGATAEADAPIVLSGGKKDGANAEISVDSPVDLVIATPKTVVIKAGTTDAEELKATGVSFGVPVAFPSFEFKNLPATGTPGRQVFCNDCRKPGEASGRGTGMMVFDDGHSRWISTAGTLAASADSDEVVRAPPRETSSHSRLRAELGQHAGPKPASRRPRSPFGAISAATAGMAKQAMD